MVWTPAFRVTGGGGDITAAIKDRLIMLRLTDKAQDETDRFELRLDDRRREGGGVIKWPEPKDVLGVSLGYRESRVVFMGDFRIDEVEHSGPPDTLAVTASAASLAKDIRAKRTEGWHRAAYPTLGDIATKIAQRHGLTPKLYPGLAAVPIYHEDQTSESDIAFLDRLAGQHDGVARPLGDMLVLAPKGLALSTSGRPITTVDLDLMDCTEWRYSYAARREAATARMDRTKQQGGIRAFWWDRDAGALKKVESGSAPFHEISFTVHSEAAARAVVETEMNMAARSQSELHLKLPGRTDFQAEGRVSLGRGWRPDMPTLWRITQVTHTISRAGYVVEVGCEEQPDQRDVVAAVATAPVHPDDAL